MSTYLNVKKKDDLTIDYYLFVYLNVCLNVIYILDSKNVFLEKPQLHVYLLTVCFFLKKNWIIDYNLKLRCVSCYYFRIKNTNVGLERICTFATDVLSSFTRATSNELFQLPDGSVTCMGEECGQRNKETLLQSEKKKKESSRRTLTH